MQCYIPGANCGRANCPAGLSFLSKFLNSGLLNAEEAKAKEMGSGEKSGHDIVHRQTTVFTANADAAAKQLLTSLAKFVSFGVVSESDGQLGFHKAFLVRDPDGHVIEIAEK